MCLPVCLQAEQLEHLSPDDASDDEQEPGAGTGGIGAQGLAEGEEEDLLDAEGLQEGFEAIGLEEEGAVGDGRLGQESGRGVIREEAVEGRARRGARVPTDTEVAAHSARLQVQRVLCLLCCVCCAMLCLLCCALLCCVVLHYDLLRYAVRRVLCLPCCAVLAVLAVLCLCRAGLGWAGLHCSFCSLLLCVVALISLGHPAVRCRHTRVQWRRTPGMRPCAGCGQPSLPQVSAILCCPLARHLSRRCAGLLPL